MTRTINNDRLTTYITNAYDKTEEEQIKAFAKMGYMRFIDNDTSISIGNDRGIDKFGKHLFKGYDTYYVSPDEFWHYSRPNPFRGERWERPFREDLYNIYVIYTPTEEHFKEFQSSVDKYNSRDEDKDDDEEWSVFGLSVYSQWEKLKGKTVWVLRNNAHYNNIIRAY